ncbi:aminopeptidase [Heyndrickxia sporothermodurans]|nr:aminopeptidase [Heyndrickxia sporothermodurans]
MYLNSYAKVIVNIGVAVEKGDLIKISFYHEHVPLVREIAKEAYKSGAKYVALDFRDREIEKDRFQFLAEKYIEEFPKPIVENELNYAESGFTNITILSPTFSSKNEQLIKRESTINKAKALAMSPVRRYGMENNNKWVVVNAPTKEWAVNVFPDLPPEKAFERLWENVYIATKSNEPDPVLAWKKQDHNLKNIAKKLNEYQFTAIHFISEKTDLTVSLVKDHVWIGGSETTKDGRSFISNIPVEEVWTMPNKYKVNGYVFVTKPLILGGQTIENIKLFFQNGKVVKIAPENEVLQSFLLTDEGASMLGEVALVPANSSIEKTGITFKSTLFDENAASHIAFGQAYIDNISNDIPRTEEELMQLGMNCSAVHLDIMIGDNSMSVYGFLNEEKILIMENGMWKI